MEEKRIDLNEIIEIAKRVSGLNKVGIYDIDTSDGKVLMAPEIFDAAFSDREDVRIHERVCGAEYPYRYSVREQDVMFTCINEEPLELDKVYGDS